MDGRIIYEAGIPEEIVEHPKREKTRAFIQRIRSFRAVISSSVFDLFQLHACMEAFRAGHTMDGLIVNGILLKTCQNAPV